MFAYYNENYKPLGERVIGSCNLNSSVIVSSDFVEKY